MSWHIKLIWHPLICLPPTVKALVLVSEACSALSCFSNGRLRQPQGPTVLGHRCPGSAWVPGLLPSCFSRASRWDLMVRSSFQCGPQAQARPQHLRSAHPASALSPRASSTGPKAASFYNPAHSSICTHTQQICLALMLCASPWPGAGDTVQCPRPLRTGNPWGDPIQSIRAGIVLGSAQESLRARRPSPDDRRPSENIF